MRETEDLDRIKELLKTVASRTAPFQSSCADTKLLAYTNPDQAQDRYKEIAIEALNEQDQLLQSEPNCRKRFSEVQDMLRKDTLDSKILDALNSLRTVYLNEILKPAVKVYLIEGKKTCDEVENLYEKVFTLDGLIEVAQFFDRMDSI